MDTLCTALGLLWKRDELFASETTGPSVLEVKEVRVTLAELMAPELRKHLRKYVGETRDRNGKPIRELGRLKREEFLEVYRQATALKT